MLGEKVVCAAISQHLYMLSALSAAPAASLAESAPDIELLTQQTLLLFSPSPGVVAYVMNVYSF